MNEGKFNKAMGAAIREQRKACGMTLVDVAKQMGYSYQQQQKNEAGTNGCSAASIVKLAGILGIGIGELYAKAGAKHDAPNDGPAGQDAFMAAHYVRRMSKPVRSALIPYLQRIAYTRGEAA